MVADSAVVDERVRREIGSGADERLRRTRAQVDALVEPPATIGIETSTVRLATVAEAVLAHASGIAE